MTWQTQSISSRTNSAPAPSSTTGLPLFPLATGQNQTQETAFSVQFVPGMPFLVFDFGVYASAMRCPVPA
eukprot:2368233-Rhodomonas_salina.2